MGDTYKKKILGTPKKNFVAPIALTVIVRIATPAERSRRLSKYRTPFHDKFRRVIGSEGHVAVETVWVGAVMEDDVNAHGHTTLFATGHTPTSPALDDQDAASRHESGTKFAFGDGSVRLLKDTINLGIDRASSTRAGGAVAGSDAF